MYLESSFRYMQTFLLFLFEIFGQMSPCNFFLIILFASLTFYFTVTHSIYKLNFLPFLHRTDAVAESPQSSLNLYNPMDCRLPGSSVHGILQARILEWGIMPFSRDLPDSGIEPTSLTSPALTGGIFITNNTWKAHRTYTVY